MSLKHRSPFGAKELFEQVDIFSVKQAPAFFIPADSPRPEKPWVWLAPTLADTSLEVFVWYIQHLIQAGVGVAGYDLGEVRGSPQSSDRFNDFYQVMIAKGFGPKPTLLAKSRGALMLLAWAFRHPHQLSAFAGIYPVCNLLSWPLKNKPLPVLDDYAMSQDQLLHSIKAYNPIDQLKPLAEAQVPMFLLHGSHDELVPSHENSDLLFCNYQAHGGSVKMDRLEGLGHDDSAAFLENQNMLQFLLQSL